MTGSVYVPFAEDRTVYIDTKKCGTTNVPFQVQVGTHDIDMGWPQDYTPSSQRIVVLASHTPLAPLVVTFEVEPAVEPAVEPDVEPEVEP